MFRMLSVRRIFGHKVAGMYVQVPINHAMLNVIGTGPYPNLYLIFDADKGTQPFIQRIDEYWRRNTWQT